MRLPRLRSLPSSVAVLLLLAGCQQADEPAAAPREATVLDTIGTHFSSARKWFGMVHDLGFDRASGGDFVPRFGDLSSELVRRTDAAGQTIAPRLPDRSTGDHTIAVGGHPDVWVRVREPGARDTAAELVDGVIVYRAAVEGGDLLYKLTPTHVDEYVYLADPPDTLRRTLRVEKGPGVSELRQTPHSVEVVDDAGAARLRVAAPLARAADGERRRGTIELHGDELVLAIDLSGLEAPVLVDPDWTTTGTMTVGHWMSAAWLLPDGDAMVAGGCALAGCPSSFAQPSCGQVLSDTEVWNQASGTWSAGPPLGTSRFSFASVNLDGSDLLAIGGCTTTGCDETTDAVERFVAADARWEPLDPISSPRAHAAAVRLAGGDVIVVGGCDGESCTGAVDRLDPDTGAWTSAAPLETARGFATATRLDDGRVLVAGGCADPACADMVATAEIYDPDADAWSAAGTLETARAGQSATRLGDGSVLVAGGCADADCRGTLATAEIWRPGTSDFEAGPAMPGPRHDHTATLLESGEVLMAGGASGATSSLPDAVVYDPSTESFATVSDMRLDRAYHNAIALPSNHVLVAGGCNPETCMPWAEVFTPEVPDVDAGVPPGDAGTSLPEPIEADSAHPAVYRTGAPSCANDVRQGLGCPLATHPLQDGDYQPNALRYEVRDDEVEDLSTHLIWQARDDGSTYARDAAAAYCEALETSDGAAGSWRLPTVVELATLIDSAQQEPSIDPAFEGTDPGGYWNSTPVASGPVQGWTVRFDFGEVVPRLATHALPVRCVRGSFVDGRLRQAGDLSVGDDTLTDVESGLEWQRRPDTVRRTWGEALRYCATLDLDGKGGWHLPTANELRGLVDYGSTGDVRVDPAFDGIEADTYWSSTPTYGIEALAQAISLNLGVQDGVRVDSPAYAVCVRHAATTAADETDSGCGCVAAGAAGGRVPVLLVLGVVALGAIRLGRRRR